MGIIRRFIYWALIISVLASILICIIDIYFGKLIAIAIPSAIAISLERLLHGWNTFNSVIFELFATFSDAYINCRFSIHVITAIAIIIVFYSRHNLHRWGIHLKLVAHRRLSLFFSGYVRPPFMLVIRRRPGKILQFLSNTFFKPENPGPPPQEDHHAYYLWPDRLRWHFFMFTVLTAFILRLDGAWFPALFVALFLIVIIPWFVYALFRRPVLESLWEVSWPSSFMGEWFKGLTDSQIQLLPCIKTYFPPFCEKWDSVYWSPRGSPRDSLLRAAINERFNAEDEKEITWHHKAFKRWIFYWCAPVWGSYIALLLLLIPKVLNNIMHKSSCFLEQWYFEFVCSPERWIPAKLTLYLLVWAWILLGVLFIWREKIALFRWSGLSEDNRKFVPFLIYRNLKDISGFFLVLSEPSVKLALSLIGAAGISAYLSFVSILYPLAVEVKNKEPIEIKTLNKPHKEMNNNTIITKVFESQ